MPARIDMRKWLLASLGVFVLVVVSEFIVHRWLLASIYAETIMQDEWMWAPTDPTGIKYQLLGYAVFALLFTYFYARLVGASLHVSGLQYGFAVGILLHLPTPIIQHGIFRLPIVLLVAWAVSGGIQCILAGLLAGWLYRPIKASTA